jgi:hypothetical protein
MAERLSTGFVDALNVTGSVKTIMTNSIIGIYSGTQPDDADDIETGVLLAWITVASGAFTPGQTTNGLNLHTVSTAGVIPKATAEVWSGLGIADGTAGWFRWYANARTTGASTSAVRVDGAIGTTSSYELEASNKTIVTGIPVIISTFLYTQKRV